MCGIAGVWGKGDRRTVEEMVSRLEHRGPDARGLHCAPDDAGVLGHCRLSIIDPEGGHQPMYNEDKTVAIVANGEIYNFRHLRERLAGRHAFRTNSDSEAAMHLFEEAHTSAARCLDGMFALAIGDGGELFLARDPIGIKPLYFARLSDGLAFASELKALTGVGERVREFPPGTSFHSGHGFRRYYRVPKRNPLNLPLEVWVRRVRETLEASVSKRMMSDVPLGAFLSGGLDSSLIAAVARRQVRDLHTFSVGVQGSPDLEAARLVSRTLGTIHHEHVLEPDEIRVELNKIIYHLESFDQDLVRSAVPTFFVSRLASEEVKVILTGEGADELFAGYRYYRDFEDPLRLHRELRRSVSSLHNINLQRVDRMTMAHSLEGRVPFLDVKMIELAQEIPPDLKLFSNGRRKREKWILRKATEDLLPAEIIWRGKQQFDEGSGIIEPLEQECRSRMSLDEFEDYRRLYPEACLRSREEAVYHRILKEVYSNPTPILDNVARWSERN